MSFLSPYMLWGAAAASIPVAIHLFFRSRYRTVPWAAMKFLLTSIEQTSRRLKFQELLLLLLRMAVLALLAMALARPMSSALSSGGGSAAVDVVMAFDTSFSMGAREGDQTRLDQARKTALRILDQLPPYSAVHVIDMGARPETLLGPRVAFNLDQARYLIDNLKLTYVPTDFRPGVKEALKVLKTSHMTGKEFYLFSDMQKLGWETEEGPLLEDLKEIGKLGPVYLVRCGNKVPLNVAVTGITPQAVSSIPQPGERINFAVLIANTGKEPAKNLQVSLMADGEKEAAETQAVALLDAGKSTTVTLSAKMKDPGLHVITASVKSDELEADNRLDQVILLRDFVKILIIDGDHNLEDAPKGASYFLGHALLPIKEEQKLKYILQTEVIHPRHATAERLVGMDLCVLVNAPVASNKTTGQASLSADFLADLDRFVREGHGLVIFAGDKVVPSDYNARLFDEAHLLPFKLKDQIIKQPKERPLHLNRETAALAAYKQFKDDKLYQTFNLPSFWQTVGVDETSARPAPVTKEAPKDGDSPPAKEEKAKAAAGPITVALRYDDGSPAIVAHQVDAGEVILFTTAAHPVRDADTGDATWTTLPDFAPTFVPLVRATVNHLLQGQSQDHNITAGNPLNWFVPNADAKKSFVLLQPDGTKRQLGTPVAEKDRYLIKLDNLSNVGMHALVALDQTAQQTALLNDPVLVDELRQGRVTIGVPIAVNPDLQESENLEALTNEQIDRKLGFPVVHATAGTAPEQYAGLDRTNREWTLWLLMAVLAVAVCEALLAWFCGRPIGAVSRSTA